MSKVVKLSNFRNEAFLESEIEKRIKEAENKKFTQKGLIILKHFGRKNNLFSRFLYDIYPLTYREGASEINGRLMKGMDVVFG